MCHCAILSIFSILVAGNPTAKCAAYFNPPEQAQTVDYDTFGKLNIQERVKVFNEISPENKAEIMRTHVKRWLEKNRNRLSPDQIAVVEQSIASITADSYRLPKRDEDMKRAKELEAKVAGVFSREDMMQAFTLDGDYIPPKDKKNP